MNVKIILTGSLLAFCSCQQEPDVAAIEERAPAERRAPSSRSRSMEEAVEIAVNAAQTLDRSRDRSRAGVRTASVSDVKVITDGESRSGEVDSLLYVVNFDNDEGFVLVPAPRIEKEVLAVVDEGSYDPLEGTDNPGFNLYLEAANNYVRRRMGSGYEPPFELTPAIIYKTVIDTIAEYGNFHRLGELAWGQQIPYNKYTPNGYTGCAPTAMAMIIAGIEYEQETLSYTFPERDINSESVYWPSVKAHKRNSPMSLESNHICYATDKDALHKTIARFMRQIGVVAKSNYTPTGTKTEKANCESTLKYYLPDRAVTQWTDYKSDQVTRIIDWGFLLMHAKNSYGQEHFWIAEGYHFLKTDTRVLEYNPDNKTWHTVTHDIKIRSVTYFNWGWDGLHNGFYDGVVFEPYDGENYSSPQYIGVSYIH